MPKRIVVVGCGVAGTTAAFHARKTDRTAEIVLIGDEKLTEYSRCGLPYAFSGIVPSLQALIGHDEAFYEQTNRVNLRLGWNCEEIDPSNRRVKLAKTSQKQSEQLTYDSLILTTGARAGHLKIPGADLHGVFTIRTMGDVEQLADHLVTTNARRVAIAGAGLTGSEMAEALLVRNVSVIQAEIVPEILPVILDPDMAAIVRQKGLEHGVEYRLQSILEEIHGKKGVVSGVRISGNDLQVDAVVIAVKVSPNTELARTAKISLGEFGGIRVNSNMETSVEHVYAAGDCVETYDRITRRYVLFQLATTAVRQALVAGVNAAGGIASYGGSTGVTTVKLFGLEVASFGPTTAMAEKLGIRPAAVRISGSTRLPYYPGGKELTVKLLADSSDAKIIGGQLVGEEGATLRANFVSMSAHLGLTADELAEVETCYSPPLAPVWDPVTIAAQALIRKLKGSKSPEATPKIVGR